MVIGLYVKYVGRYSTPNRIIWLKYVVGWSEALHLILWLWLVKLVSESALLQIFYVFEVIETQILHQQLLLTLLFCRSLGL